MRSYAYDSRSGSALRATLSGPAAHAQAPGPVQGNVVPSRGSTSLPGLSTAADRAAHHVQLRARDPMTALGPAGRRTPLPRGPAEGASSEGLAPVDARPLAIMRACGASCECAKCSKGEAIQREAHPGAAQPDVDPAEIRGRLGPGMPLPGPMVERFSASFHRDLSMVRIHQNGALARELGARAFTVGRDIVFDAGEYRPGTPEGDRLIAHELAHVVQQAGGPGVSGGGKGAGPEHEAEADRASSAVADGQPVGVLTGVGEPAVQNLSLRGAVSAIGGGIKRVGRAVEAVAEAAWDELVDQFWSFVDSHWPTAGRYLRNPGQLWTDIKDAVTAGARGLIDTLFGKLNPAASFKAIGSFFSTVVEELPKIASGLASLSFSGFVSALGSYAKIAAAGVDVMIAPAEALLTVIDGAVTALTTWIGKPVIDLLKSLAGVVWTAVEAVVDALTFIPRKIGSVLRKVWNWLKGKLGLGDSSGDAGGGILGWIAGKAKAVWDAAYETVFGWVKTLVKFGASVARSPFAALRRGLAVLRKMASFARQLGDALKSPSAAIAGRRLLKTLLEAVKAFFATVGGMLAAAWSTLSPLLEAIYTVVSTLFSAVATVVKWIGGALSWLGSGLMKVLKWVPEKINAGFKKAAESGENASPWVQRLLGFASFLINLAVNPLAIPMLIMGTLWKLLPASWKLTIMRWVVGLLLIILRSTSLAVLTIMGPLAAIAHQAIIGLLERVQSKLKGGTKAEENSVIKLSDRLAGIMQGTSMSFTLGLISGLIEGIWDGLTGPFQLVALILEGIGAIASFFGGLASNANPYLQKIGKAISSAWNTVSGKIGGALRSWLSEGSGGEGVKKIVGLVMSLGGAIAKGAQQVGAAIADALFDFLSMADYAYGNKAGYIGGLVLFEVVLAILTAGVSAGLKFFSTVIGKVLKVLVEINKVVGKIFEKIIEFIPGLKRGLESVIKLVAESKAFKPIIEAIKKMFAELEAAGMAAMRRAGGDMVTEAAEVGGARLATVADSAPSAARSADNLPTRKLEGQGPATSAERKASTAESGAVDNAVLTERQAIGELDAIKAGEIPTTGVPPNRKAKIGDHVWEEGPNGQWCRHSPDPFCVVPSTGKPPVEAPKGEPAPAPKQEGRPLTKQEEIDAAWSQRQQELANAEAKAKAQAKAESEAAWKQRERETARRDARRDANKPAQEERAWTKKEAREAAEAVEDQAKLAKQEAREAEIMAEREARAEATEAAAQARAEARAKAREMIEHDPAKGGPKFREDALEARYQDYLARKKAANQPARPRDDWKVESDYWRLESPTARGNKFNETSRARGEYDAYELNLETPKRPDGTGKSGNRLDSYKIDPKNPANNEIISRKAVDFDSIDKADFKAYLQELKDKYPPGTKIRTNAYKDLLDGQTLQGKQVLEVPDVNIGSANQKAFEDLAKAQGIEVRYRPE